MAEELGERLSDLEASVSGRAGRNYYFSLDCYGAPSSPAGRRRRAPAVPPRSPRAAMFFCEYAEEEGRHFLDACALCNKSLRGNGDIFMYRGDMPFCSEECRQEQIDMDEAKERSSSRRRMKASESSLKERQEQEAAAADAIRVRAAAGTVVAG